jgi:hypothetical protein
MWRSTDLLASTASTNQPFATPSSTPSRLSISNQIPTHPTLAIGPDPAGNLLEIIWLELAEVNLVIHAMPLRPPLYDLLPQSPEDLP